jgi:hypothetical protein
VIRDFLRYVTGYRIIKLYPRGKIAKSGNTFRPCQSPDFGFIYPAPLFHVGYNVPGLQWFTPFHL